MLDVHAVRATLECEVGDIDVRVERLDDQLDAGAGPARHQSVERHGIDGAGGVAGVTRRAEEGGEVFSLQDGGSTPSHVSCITFGFDPLKEISGLRRKQRRTGMRALRKDARRRARFEVHDLGVVSQ